ncbi:MAG: hypothetical protein HQL17_01730 [Candidatus Omnitrophica bacterium]|nr:hypothetical protein [Candidatus Omnitrophota bacterium]
MSDRFFLYAVVISLAVHAGCLTYFMISHRGTKFWKPRAEMAYNIVKPPPAPQVVAPETGIHDVNSDLLEKIIDPVKLAADAQVTGKVPQPKDLESSFKEPDIMDSAKLFDRKPERLKGVKVTKEVSVPMLKSDKINTPSYITYYQIVRDRIRDRAYSNYIKLSVGEVFVTFIIKDDGSLSGLQILESKSSANDFLREVGLKSVQEGAPFPPFPKDLNYPELTFNVSISFQYREE